MDLGQGFASAGASIGAGLTTAADQYHKEHVTYDQQLAIANAISRLGVDKTGNIVPSVDAEGKSVQDVQPLLNKKAFESFTNVTAQKRAAAAGALSVINRIGLERAQHAISSGDSTLKDALIKSRTQLSQAHTAAVLGLVPPKPAPPPTGGQILANQRALIKGSEAQQKRIEDKFTTLGYPDPAAVADSSKWIYGTQSQGGWGQPKAGTFIPSPNNDPTGATHVQIQGSWFPVAQATALQPQALQWQKLGAQAEISKKQAQTLQDKWLSQPANVQSKAAQMLLSNPTPEMKAFFDQKFGQGAADAVISAHVAPSPTPAPETPEDTSGESDSGE